MWVSSSSDTQQGDDGRRFVRGGRVGGRPDSPFSVRTAMKQAPHPNHLGRDGGGGGDVGGLKLRDSCFSGY